jgi:hypothetical protein
MNYATAHPLSLSDGKREGIPSWLPLPRNEDGTIATGGDTLDTWIKPFPAETVAAAFEALLDKWAPGVDILADAARRDPENTRLAQERALAEHIWLSLRSTVNIVRFHTGLRAWKTSKKRGVPRALSAILEEEIVIASRDRELLEISGPSPAAMRMENGEFLHAIDCGLGFHPEAHERYFTMKDLDAKIALHTKELARIQRKKQAEGKRKKGQR